MKKLMLSVGKYLPQMNERTFWIFFSTLLIMVLSIGISEADTLPWEKPLTMVMQSLCGPVARASAVIAVVITGLLVAFGEMKGVFSVMIRVVFGLSIALMAVQWLSNMFTIAGVAC